MGRPNVGKSSLCNRLLNMERLIVSDKLGTTCETVELDLDYKIENEPLTWYFRLFDTAGLSVESASILHWIIFLRHALNMQSNKSMWFSWFWTLERALRNKIRYWQVISLSRVKPCQFW